MLAGGFVRADLERGEVRRGEVAELAGNGRSEGLKVDASRKLPREARWPVRLHCIDRCDAGAEDCCAGFGELRLRPALTPTPWPSLRSGSRRLRLPPAAAERRRTAPRGEGLGRGGVGPRGKRSGIGVRMGWALAHHRLHASLAPRTSRPPRPTHRTSVSSHLATPRASSARHARLNACAGYASGRTRSSSPGHRPPCAPDAAIIPLHEYDPRRQGFRPRAERAR